MKKLLHSMKEPLSSIAQEYRLQELHHRHSGGRYAFASARDLEVKSKSWSFNSLDVWMKGSGTHRILTRAERANLVDFLTENPALLEGHDPNSAPHTGSVYKRASVSGIPLRGFEYEKKRKTIRSCVKACYLDGDERKDCYGRVLFF